MIHTFSRLTPFVLSHSLPLLISPFSLPSIRFTSSSDSEIEYISISEVLNGAKSSFKATIQHLKGEFDMIQAGRLTSQLLEQLPVDAYNMEQPLKAVGSIAFQHSRNSFMVNLFDPSVQKSVINSLLTSDLGLAPVKASPKQIQIPLPKVTTEYREKQVKKAIAAADHSKQAIKNIRRKNLDLVKELKPPKDDAFQFQKDLQKHVEESNSQVDSMLKQKTKSLMED